jgi:hypothetical protein
MLCACSFIERQIAALVKLGDGSYVNSMNSILKK